MWKREQMQKSRLFNATDFQSLMYPCFTICRFLGIYPYKINASTFEISKRHYILSTVIICACCVFDLSLIHEFISKVNLGMIKTLEVISFYTVNSFIVIIAQVSSGSRMRLLQSISEISSEIPSKSYQELSKLIHVKDIFGTILVIVLIYIYFFKEHLFEVNYFTILIVIFTTHLSVLEFQINMLYMNCVCVLKACFKKINENVAYMHIINDTHEPCVPRLICHMPRNQFLLIELKTLKKQHLLISDAMKMLNTIFSLQLLATIIITFSNITFELYLYVVRWQDGLLIIIHWHFFDVILIIIMFHVIKIILLIWVCETGKHEAQKLNIIIHDVLNSISNEQIKNELRLFSLQILHHRNIFSAKGFTMNANLLATIVGNITTYMLILIQFLITSHSCDNKYGTNVTNSFV